MKKFTASATWKCRCKMCCLFLPFSFLFLLCSVSVLSLFPPPRFLFLTLKYAKYLESYSTDGVRHVYKKACTIHLPKKPAIHLLWAAFEEQQGEGHSFKLSCKFNTTVKLTKGNNDWL